MLLVSVETVVSSVQVVQGPDWLVVDFGSGAPRRSAFHFRWLRHHTKEDRHPITGERTLCSSELPDDLAPLSARIEAQPQGSVLAVAWSDARNTEHDLSWLQEHAYASEHDIPVEVDARVASYELWREQRSFDEIAREAVEQVNRLGLVVVRAPAGSDPESETEGWIEAFARAGLDLVGTHFGRIEDLRPDNTTNSNTDQLGYTDAAIQLHTDQPFLEEPPRYQMLQGVVRATHGGDNVFVDAREASNYYASIASYEHSLLASLPVRFSRRQKHFSRDVDSPILRLATAEQPFRVRYSYFTLAPLSFPFALMSSFYRAHDAFARMVREPGRGVRVSLAPGDIALYDNHRMLHSRTPFEGSRWVRGVYFNPSGAAAR